MKYLRITKSDGEIQDLMLNSDSEIASVAIIEILYTKSVDLVELKKTRKPSSKRFNSCGRCGKVNATRQWGRKRCKHCRNTPDGPRLEHLMGLNHIERKMKEESA